MYKLVLFCVVMIFTALFSTTAYADIQALIDPVGTELHINAGTDYAWISAEPGTYELTTSIDGDWLDWNLIIRKEPISDGEPIFFGKSGTVIVTEPGILWIRTDCPYPVHLTITDPSAVPIAEEVPHE